MTHPASGNATWQDYPSTATIIDAASLERMEAALDLTKWTYRTVSANTTANNNEKLYVDASGGAVVISVPTSPVSGTKLFVQATAATTTNTVTLNWTINGDSTGVQLTAAGAGVHVSYNGTGWFIDYPTSTLARITGGNAPPSAGFRSGYYSVSTSQYTPSVSALTRIRAFIDQAATGSLVNLVCAGDSRTVGYFASPNTPLDGWPSRLRARLASFGIPSAGTGLVMASNAAVTLDSRITYTGTWTSQQPYRAWGASGSTATFTTDVAGAIVEVYYYSNSGTFTVKIGANAAQAVSPAGGGTNVAVASYSTAVTAGTQIVVSSTSASGSLIGFCVRNTSGILVHSVAYSGFTSTQLAATGSLTLQQIISYINPSLLGIMIGTNDPSASITPATHATNLNTIGNTNNPNAIKFLICQSPYPSQQAAWPPYVSAQYDYADSITKPLLDLNDKWSSPALANSAGILGSDSIHETVAGCEDIARSVARMLTT